MLCKTACPSYITRTNACLTISRTGPDARVRSLVCRAEYKTGLERIVKRKSQEIQNQVEGLGYEWLEEKLQDAMSQPLTGNKQFKFGQALSEAMMRVCYFFVNVYIGHSICLERQCLAGMDRFEGVSVRLLGTDLQPTSFLPSLLMYLFVPV